MLNKYFLKFKGFLFLFFLFCLFATFDFVYKDIIIRRYFNITCFEDASNQVPDYKFTIRVLQ